MKLTKNILKKLIREELLKENKLNDWPGYVLPSYDLSDFSFSKEHPYTIIQDFLHLAYEISSVSGTQRVGIDAIGWPIYNKKAASNIAITNRKEIEKLMNKSFTIKNQFGKAMKQLDKDIKKFIAKTKIGK